MKALVGLIKWLIIIVVTLSLVSSAITFGYLLYSEAQADKALTERTNYSDWQWQRDKGLGNRHSSDVQWGISEEYDYIMRRVYDDHQVIAVLSKTHYGEIRLNYAAYWPADCKEGTSIETTDGGGETLKCVKASWGNELAIEWWSDIGVDLDDLPSWSKNFDGFEVDEDFSRTWDFQPALRYLTLQSAKTQAELEEERIAAIEAERAAEELRLAQEEAEAKAAEELRIAQEKAEEIRTEKLLIAQKEARERLRAAAEERRIAEETE